MFTSRKTCRHGIRPSAVPHARRGCSASISAIGTKCSAKRRIEEWGKRESAHTFIGSIEWYCPIKRYTDARERGTRSVRDCRIKTQNCSPRRRKGEERQRIRADLRDLQEYEWRNSRQTAHRRVTPNLCKLHQPCPTRLLHSEAMGRLYARCPTTWSPTSAKRHPLLDSTRTLAEAHV